MEDCKGFLNTLQFILMIFKEAKIKSHLGHYSDQTEISATPQVSQPMDWGRGQKTNQASRKPKTTTNNNKKNP